MSLPALTFVALLPLALLPAPPAAAQAPAAGGMHTAPGKPLRVQRPSGAGYSPARAVAPTVLPRFWAAPDSATRAAQQRQLWLHLARKLSYPPLVLRDAAEGPLPTGEFQFRLVVNPDGSVQPPALRRRRLVLAESAYKASSLQALEAEVRRVFASTRFEPATRTDTLTLPVVFNPNP
jgi:hypothetical protein